MRLCSLARCCFLSFGRDIFAAMKQVFQALLKWGRELFFWLWSASGRLLPDASLLARPSFRWGAGILGAFIACAILFTAFLFLRDGRDNLADGFYRVGFAQYYRAAEAGAPEAQTIIGNLYLLGLGVREDQALAAHWYLKAAISGYVPAQINLGQLYWNGLGVPRRVGSAVGWFHLARQAGSDRADAHLKYIGKTNSVLPLMYDTAVLKFATLERVKARLDKEGELAFLME